MVKFYIYCLCFLMCVCCFAFPNTRYSFAFLLFLFHLVSLFIVVFMCDCVGFVFLRIVYIIVRIAVYILMLHGFFFVRASTTIVT